MEQATNATRLPDSRVLLTSASGAAVLGLGVLYASGALLEATRLHGAHVQVRDTLPLIPLPSLLSLGIGVVIGALAWTVAFGAAVRLLMWVGAPDSERSDGLADQRTLLILLPAATPSVGVTPPVTPRSR